MSMSNVSAAGVNRIAAVERVARQAPASGAVPEQPRPPAATVPVADSPGRDLEAATVQIERAVRASGRNLQFRVDDESGRVVVSVRDSDTGELIRQIPSEAALRIARSLDQGQPVPDSLLVEERA